MSDVKRMPAEGRRTLRAERALVTRQRIADAARRLFRREGYAATTLTDIAAEAGVAVQTVYAVYGSKAGILGSLRESVMSQPEAEALYGQAMADPSAAHSLELFARSIRVRFEHSGDVVVILRDAATADATIREGVAATLLRRRAGLRQLAERLAPSLRAGLDVAAAAAILDALTLPEVREELVDVQGWTPDAYEAWLAGVLTRELLGAG
jgi:AcrR family transcriptional regulator